VNKCLFKQLLWCSLPTSVYINIIHYEVRKNVLHFKVKDRKNANPIQCTKLQFGILNNVVPSHNLLREKEPERLQSTYTQSIHFSDSDWHSWTKATQNMFWVRPYFHFLNYLLWVFYYCLNENENHYILSTDTHQEKKMIGNTDYHLCCNSDISAASQHANKHK